MKKTQRKKQKQKNTTRKVGGVRPKNRHPRKKKFSLRHFFTSRIVNTRPHILSRLQLRRLSINSMTNLERLILKESNNSLVRIINTSVFSRVLLINTPIGNIILKICVITPESMVLPTKVESSSAYKYSVTRTDFENEYEYLSENSDIGICPEPHFIEIYDYDPKNLPPIFVAIQTSLRQNKKPVIAGALHKTFLDMNSLLQSGVPVSYGIIGMEYIEGISLSDYFDENDSRERAQKKIIKQQQGKVPLIIEERLEYELRQIQQEHRLFSQKICILLLLFYMNGYANSDCLSTNILIRQSDKKPFMIDFGQCSTRSDGFKNQPDIMSSELTDEVVLKYYMDQISSFFRVVIDETHEPFLRKFITTNDKLTVADMLSREHIKYALICIRNSSHQYDWMDIHGFLDYITNEGFISQIHDGLQERLEKLYWDDYVAQSLYQFGHNSSNGS